MNSPGKRTVAASDGGTAVGRDLHIYLIDLRRTKGSRVTIRSGAVVVAGDGREGSAQSRCDVHCRYGGPAKIRRSA